MRPAVSISVEIAPGELIDKITILEIKAERMTDATKLENVRLELATLAEARDAAIKTSPQLVELTAQLPALTSSSGRSKTTSAIASEIRTSVSVLWN